MKVIKRIKLMDESQQGASAVSEWSMRGHEGL